MDMGKGWIWCPLDKIRIKREDGQWIWVNNSVGPNKHVLWCLRDGCECQNLRDKLDELEKLEKANGNRG